MLLSAPHAGVLNKAEALGSGVVGRGSNALTPAVVSGMVAANKLLLLLQSILMGYTSLFKLEQQLERLIRPHFPSATSSSEEITLLHRLNVPV